MTRHILTIDQGTTNTKALVVATDGRVVARASRPVDVRFPQPGWVEQDARALWRTVVDAVDESLARAGVVPDVVAATNQRESVVLWERASGEPLGPVVVWQCRRTAPMCERLRAAGHTALLQSTTGLTVDPLFSATKARWLLDQVKDGAARAAAGELCLGTIDSWLLWNLTGGRVHACDATNASRTQLYALDSGTWHPGLLDLFGVPSQALPTIQPSSSVFGETVAVGRLPAGIPVGALVGDSHAALVGHGAFQPGSVKATYGTGSSLMSPVPARIDVRGLSSTVAWSLPSGVQFALEGNITDTGGAVDWTGRLLGSDRPDDYVATLAAGVPDSGGVYLVPAFAGLGAPHWDADVRGLVSGLTRAAGPAELARAAVESIAYQIHDVFQVMVNAIDASSPILLADGGASRNDQLMQFQADILGVPVLRNTSADLSALGAAWLAGLALGLWTSLDDLASLPRSLDRFDPRMAVTERGRLLSGWRAAVARARLEVQ